MNTSTKAINSIIPSFDSGAKAIVAAQTAHDRIAVKSSDAIVKAIQKHIDACATAGVPRSLAGVNAIGRSIRECQIFIDAVATGFFERKTITEYAQGAMRAYFHNVAFTATLKNDPAYKIPAEDGSVKGGSGKGGSGKGGSGKGGSMTTVADFHATLISALQQARTLGLIEQAADMLDFCLESFDGFSETDADTL